MRENKFQINVATGRFTLPVVVFVCLLLWLLGIDSWKELGTMVITAITGYLMVEANTAFTLIRTRTTLPVCIYWLLTAALLFLHSFEWSSFTPLAFMLATYQLFNSYESPHPSAALFHTFFFISLGSLGFPQLLYFAPLFFFSSIGFRSMNIKSFFAGILGLMVPYWLLFGHAFFHDKMNLFYAPFRELVRFQSIENSPLPLHEIISWGTVFAFQLISSIHYFQVSYQDKTRTRINLTFLVVAGWWTAMFVLLQRQHLHVLLPIQLICTSFLTGHLFTLTRNRFSGILFIVTFVSVITLIGYNLWMEFFNF